MLNLIRHKILITILLTGVFFNTNAQIILSESAEVSLLTCSPGEELYALFGHSAMRVVDHENNLDVVFNYGTFSFDEDFYYNFTMGQLNYMLSPGSMSGFMRAYQNENRGVIEQVLDLSLEQKQAVFDFLVWNAEPENKYYLYDFFYDNCSSRLRDVLDSVLADGNIQFPNMQRPGKPTFRNMIDEYLVFHPWGDLGIDIGLGLPCDKVVGNTEYVFLPNELMRAYTGATLEGRPLVKQTRTLLESPEWKLNWSITDPIPLMWILCGVLLSLSALGYRRGSLWIGLDVFYLFITGAVGILVFFLWFISDHMGTVNNLNILWAWPTHWLALPLLGIARFRRYYWLFYGGILILTLITFPVLPQMLHLAVLPLIIAGIFRAFINWRLPLQTHATA